MQIENHSITSLFEQLGIGDSEEDINRFINRFAPIPSAVELHEAHCWNQAQAAFLKQAKEEDADWAEVVDQLNVMLRQA